VFVGVKMLIEPWVQVPIWLSLLFILVAIGGAGVTSWRADVRAQRAPAGGLSDAGEPS
jgi:hypothetical protein